MKIMKWMRIGVTILIFCLCFTACAVTTPPMESLLSPDEATESATEQDVTSEPTEKESEVGITTEEITTEAGTTEEVTTEADTTEEVKEVSIPGEWYLFWTPFRKGYSMEDYGEIYKNGFRLINDAEATSQYAILFDQTTYVYEYTDATVTVELFQNCYRVGTMLQYRVTIENKTDEELALQDHARYGEVIFRSDHNVEKNQQVLERGWWVLPVYGIATEEVKDMNIVRRHESGNAGEDHEGWIGSLEPRGTTFYEYVILLDDYEGDFFSSEYTYLLQFMFAYGGVESIPVKLINLEEYTVT